ncbi:hypothetical protein DPMN_025984 [Dreissena polymorpha]|uniref:Uncharacterized protein n=1 Tax=Dreissena polymorpha TaxID=45954 RepID=A0A9D4RD17_DREPO|nr:hypothetical protein DPMN_025984 [Dreissena polymorpha]
MSVRPPRGAIPGIDPGADPCGQWPPDVVHSQPPGGLCHLGDCALCKILAASDAALRLSVVCTLWWGTGRCRS